MNPTASIILPSSRGKVSHVTIAAVELSAEQIRRAFETLKRRVA